MSAPPARHLQTSNLPLSLHASVPAAEFLRHTAMFRDYQDAFQKATGLPLELHGVGEPFPKVNTPNGDSFCEIMARHNKTCAACLSLQAELESGNGDGPRTATCFGGLLESAVPVTARSRTIAYLLTGRVHLQPPNAEAFAQIKEHLAAYGIDEDMAEAEDAWFAAAVCTETQYNALLRLVILFARHLSEYANANAIDTLANEPDAVRRAKKIIKTAAAAEDFSIQAVAKAVHLSPGYFSELFRKSTGMTFTRYVAQVRVEKVKQMLRNPRLQVTTVAYDCGFQSLSQFNRVFKSVAGLSPSEWRAQYFGRCGIKEGE